MTTLLQRAREGKPLDIEIIDMHGHLGRFSFAIPDLSPERLVESMDRLGVRSIVCSHMRCMSVDTEYGNAEVAKAMQACPGRILGYVSVYPIDPQTVRRNVERWLAAGFTGLKLHNSNGFSYTDPAYEPAYAIADERRLPMLFHTWGEDSEFSEIRSIAGRYPQTAILLAHSACVNEDEYIRMAKDCPNVYLELCYSHSPLGLVARLAEAVGAEKVVWGSDCYFYSQVTQAGRVIGADLPDEAKVQILSGNAQRMLDRIRRES